MRVEGWEKLLREHIKEAYHRPFTWGEFDCALWCADWIRKATGQDFAREWKALYGTAAEAQALMEGRGFNTVEAIADHHLTSVPVTFAQRGDIMLHEEMCLGISHGRSSYFLRAADVIMTPTLSCIKAWTVG